MFTGQVSLTYFLHIGVFLMSSLRGRDLSSRGKDFCPQPPQQLLVATFKCELCHLVAEYRLAALLQSAVLCKKRCLFKRCTEPPLKCKPAPCPLQLPGVALALLHLALYDCQGLQFALLHLYALAPCTLAHVICQGEGVRGMEALGRRREGKCRDAFSFRSRERKNNFYATK